MHDMHFVASKKDPYGEKKMGPTLWHNLFSKNIDPMWTQVQEGKSNCLGKASKLKKRF